MKTNQTLLALLTGITAFAFTGLAHAGGIVASPKHRDAISGRAGIASVPVVNVKSTTACPACKHEYVTRIDATARGAFKPTIVSVKHLCEGCETVTRTVGVGKGAKDVKMHTCSNLPAGGSGCCPVDRKS